MAPFFGFLGTVTGMISAFKAVAAVGEVEATVVASGIAEALITTKWGLIIAAPLSIFYILFSGRVSGYLRDMETASGELIDFLMARGLLQGEIVAISLRKKGGGGNANIPTASTGDIAFLIMIFFMSTSMFAKEKGLKIVLPEPTPGEERTVKITPENLLQCERESARAGPGRHLEPEKAEYV